MNVRNRASLSLEILKSTYSHCQAIDESRHDKIAQHIEYTALLSSKENEVVATEFQEGRKEGRKDGWMDKKNKVKAIQFMTMIAAKENEDTSTEWNDTTNT